MGQKAPENVLPIADAPLQGVAATLSLLHAANNPRAIFRVRIILSHLRVSFPPALQASSAVHNDTSSLEHAILLWPLTDAAGNHLESLFHSLAHGREAASWEFNPTLPPSPLPQFSANHQQLPQSAAAAQTLWTAAGSRRMAPSRPRPQAIGASDVDRWWPAL
mmetsp:Transcript_67344/g.161468  ORF Transcript_67344/g.161468 Transcript_67344/m.161468 type:complete len:163 (+) Transcript_67344:100-588(+)